MEHINVKDIGNGYWRLVPDEGYMLLDRRNNMMYSEAITKDKEWFVAVAIDKE